MRQIVLDGLRRESSIAELCGREGIAEGLGYSWSKAFLEAGKRRLAGDMARAPTSIEVTDRCQRRRAGRTRWPPGPDVSRPTSQSVASSGPSCRRCRGPAGTSSPAIDCSCRFSLLERQQTITWFWDSVLLCALIADVVAWRRPLASHCFATVRARPWLRPLQHAQPGAATYHGWLRRRRYWQMPL
jgi:transposase